MENNLIYCTTWSCSPELITEEDKPPLTLSNNSIRQTVCISLGANKLRIKLSNKFGNDKLEINSVSIAKTVGKGTGEIDISTNKQLTFNNNQNVILEKGEEIYSDCLNFELVSLSVVSISIFFGKVPSNLTGHHYFVADSFIENGNKINEKKFSSNYVTNKIYILSNIEILTENDAKGVVCFGDSLIDGKGSVRNKYEGWTYFFASYLLTNKSTSNISVINQGVSGTTLIKDGLKRFEHDALEQKGVRYIIVFYGLNDILKKGATCEEVTSAYKTLIKKSHEANILIYGITLPPYNRKYEDSKNDIRNEVNKWIRNTKKEDGGFDYVFDFEPVLKDPKNDQKMNKLYGSGDGLHPNSVGYEKLAKVINDFSLFTK